MNIITKNADETFEFAKNFSKLLHKGIVILLIGDLGVGKTLFTKGIGAGLGIKNEITSPTFNILKIYQNEKIILNHIDAYRLINYEYDNIGLEEAIFDKEAITIIEWPSNIPNFLPKDYIEIKIIIIEENIRKISFKSNNEKYGNIINKVKEL